QLRHSLAVVGETRLLIGQGREHGELPAAAPGGSQLLFETGERVIARQVDGVPHPVSPHEVEQPRYTAGADVHVHVDDLWALAAGPRRAIRRGPLPREQAGGEHRERQSPERLRHTNPGRPPRTLPPPRDAAHARTLRRAAPTG